MRTDELENRPLMKFMTDLRNHFNSIHGIFFVGVMFEVECWCFFLITLHATHFVRSIPTNSSNLGKCTFVMSSPMF